MANTGPIQVTQDLSNIRNFPDLVRFIAAFSTQVTQNFNGLLSTKTAWGVVGVTGVVTSGSSNFSVNFVRLGTYQITFRQTFHSVPAAMVTAQTFSIVHSASLGIGGFFVRTWDRNGQIQNVPFSFIAMGGK